MRLVIALVLVAGCWRGGSDTTPDPLSNDESGSGAPVRERGASCDEVSANVRVLIDGSTQDDLKPRAAQIAMVVERRCREDGWSMELRRCIAGAKQLNDTDGCEKLATEEQSKKLDDDIKLEENAN